MINTYYLFANPSLKFDLQSLFLIKKTIKMIRIILVISSILLSGLCFGQTITFEETSPASQLQDADLGSMDFADIDNDGDNDLMITGKGGPVKSSLYRNDGSGNFTEITGTGIVNVYSGTVGFGDVDGDGDQDLLITGATSSPVRTANLYINDGTGNYSLAMNTPFAASEAGDFAFGDVDGDGDKDVIMNGYDLTSSPFSTLYLNDGSGVFSEAMGTPFEAVWDGSVEFIDIENDNDLDVIMTGRDTNGNPSTTLYTNDGTGIFNQVANTNLDNCKGSDVKVADMDNDGDIDILLSGESNNGIITKLYLNDGMGAFTELAGTPFSPVNIGENALADFDNDGDVDVFILGTGAGGLINNAIVANIYENQGGNNFILADSLIGAYFSNNAVADIDGDNDLDLVFGGTTVGSPTRATRMYRNITQITSVTERENDLNVRVFPNPSNGIINIELDESFAYNLNVYNVVGELVYSNNSLNEMNSQITLNQPSGLYIVVLKTADKIKTVKLIIE